MHIMHPIKNPKFWFLVTPLRFVDQRSSTVGKCSSKDTKIMKCANLPKRWKWTSYRRNDSEFILRCCFQLYKHFFEVINHIVAVLVIPLFQKDRS